jgi:mRNA-degrading endonuclease YafQ of YafQ-DinJ toxin-antitoxin module
MLQQMGSDIYHPSLKTHKLMGDLDDSWSCPVDHSYRILFEFAIDLWRSIPEVIAYFSMIPLAVRLGKPTTEAITKIRY